MSSCSFFTYSVKSEFRLVYVSSSLRAFFTFWKLIEAGLCGNPGWKGQTDAKKAWGARGKLLYVNTQKKSMQRLTQSHNIQSVNLLDPLKFQNLPALVLEKEISFSYKDRQNELRRNGLLDLLNLNLIIPHKISASYIVV